MTTEVSEFFEIHYRFYKYNSGDGECGTFSNVRTRKTAEEAIDLVKRIRECVNNEDLTEDQHELEKDLLPSHGYLVSAEAFKVRRETQRLDI